MSGMPLVDAALIVDLIVQDILTRSGALGNAWDSMEPEEREVVVKRWEAAVALHIDSPPSRGEDE